MKNNLKLTLAALMLLAGSTFTAHAQRDLLGDLAKYAPQELPKLVPQDALDLAKQIDFAAIVTRLEPHVEEILVQADIAQGIADKIQQMPTATVGSLPLSGAEIKKAVSDALVRVTDAQFIISAYLANPTYALGLLATARAAMPFQLTPEVNEIIDYVLAFIKANPAVFEIVAKELETILDFLHNKLSVLNAMSPAQLQSLNIKSDLVELGNELLAMWQRNEQLQKTINNDENRAKILKLFNTIKGMNIDTIIAS